MFLQEKLGIEFPFIQGGMARIATAEFAAAVSEAGGLGLIGGGGLTSDKFREEIRKAKELTDKPFGVNLMLLQPNSSELADIVVEEGVKIVTTGAGNPSKYIDKWKEAGILVFPVVSNPSMCIRLEKRGVDGLIAEGNEAGGHIGKMTTMTLIPQIKDKVDLPVIAAGGIASGRQMYAAEILGADGFQLGTSFLATEECPIHDNYKEKIIRSNDTQITVIGDIAGLPSRVIKNQMTREYISKEKEGAGLEELERYTLGALADAVYDGDITNGSLMAGLVVGQVNEVKPLRQMMEDLYEEYKELKR